MATAHSKNNSSPNILIMAAGTGGHVFPALAVAKKLQAQGANVIWLATNHGMENRLLEGESIQIENIHVLGLRGNGIKRLLFAPFVLLKATLNALRVIRAHRIDAVVGFGGYVAGPGGLAAKLSRTPLFIHEQNAVAGMTNKILAPWCTQVFEAFEGAFAGVKLKRAPLSVGNPLRDTIETRTHESVGKRLMVVGGSLGARVFNQTLPKALKHLPADVVVTHQCGRGNLEETQQAYAEQNPVQQVEIKEFITDMGGAYAAHDLVLCRAGALTVSELAKVGMPSVLVPLPSAVDDHQTKNAQFLSNAGAGELLAQSDMTPERLAQVLEHSLSAGVLAKRRQALSQFAEQNASQHVVDLVLSHIKEAS